MSVAWGVPQRARRVSLRNQAIEKPIILESEPTGSSAAVPNGESNVYWSFDEVCFALTRPSWVFVPPRPPPGDLRDQYGETS